MKTIIHIGQHKTATTSIQQFLQDNRKTLARTGLYVPSQIAGHRSPSHFILNVYALATDRFSSQKDRIIAQNGKNYISELESVLRKDIEKIYEKAVKNNCDQVIWSNEGLYLLNSVEEYQRLTNLFAQYSTEIEVVCCFRDVASYRESYLRQLQKQEITPSSDPDSYRYLEPDSWLFDYQRKKELLGEVFNKCNYFTYDPNDNVKKFMEVIGVEVDNSGDYRFNVTGSPRNQLLHRLRKTLGAVFPGKQRESLKN